MPNEPRDEIAFDLGPQGPWTWLTDPRHPVSVTQALMEAAPNDKPQESLEELQLFREAVADCLTTLDEEDRYILNAIEVERITQRELGDRMGIGKSHANRLVKQARANLEPLLRAHPLIKERYPFMVPSTWDEAAEDAFNFIRIISRTTLAVPLRSGIDNAKALMQKGWDNTAQVNNILIGIGATAYEYLALHALHVLPTVVPTLIERHHKYGVGNINEFREIGLLVRMSDKVARIENGDDDYEDESFLDAYVDLVGYACIAHMLAEGWFLLPLRDD